MYLAAICLLALGCAGIVMPQQIGNSDIRQAPQMSQPSQATRPSQSYVTPSPRGTQSQTAQQQLPQVPQVPAGYNAVQPTQPTQPSQYVPPSYVPSANYYGQSNVTQHPLHYPIYPQYSNNLPVAEPKNNLRVSSRMETALVYGKYTMIASGVILSITSIFFYVCSYTEYCNFFSSESSKQKRSARYKRVTSDYLDDITSMVLEAIVKYNNQNNIE